MAHTQVTKSERRQSTYSDKPLYVTAAWSSTFRSCLRVGGPGRVEGGEPPSLIQL